MGAPKAISAKSAMSSKQYNDKYMSSTKQTEEADACTSDDFPGPFAGIANPQENEDSATHLDDVDRNVPGWFTVEAPSTYVDRHREPQVTWFVTVMTYTAFMFIIVMGHLRDFFGRLFGRSRYLLSLSTPGVAPLFKSWENFYTRRLYHRIQDCWNRPIGSAPGAKITVLERGTADGNKTLHLTGAEKECLNLGSYNYLGFADDWQQTCKRSVMPVLKDLPVGCSSSRGDFGTTSVHRKLELLLAEFLGTEAAVVFNMGYATNSTTIPALCGKGTLIISDSLNHMSIVTGCRASGAHIRVFKHNDAADLEEVMREAIIMGMPRTRRPWKKIMVMVEGIYSMEGEICDLKGITTVCKKYKAYIYLDEAHSIGALGETGRGATEYCRVNPRDVDIMMGTFTKSFGGMGGYIAGSKQLVDHIRVSCAGLIYHNALSPVVAQQVSVALRVIMGQDGTSYGATKLRALKDNSNYVRKRLIDMGLHVYGDYNSPVIPVMLYMPAQIAAFSRECYRRGLAVVVVGFPATSVVTGRTRICISAGHRREQLVEAMQKIEEVVDLCQLRYNNTVYGGR